MTEQPLLDTNSQGAHALWALRMAVDKLTDLDRTLGQIARSLSIIAQASLPAEPNYRYPFEAYGGFDWGEIGADVVASDEYGATTVRWGGYANWTRRFQPSSSTRKQSIWFSRAAAAEDSDGTRWFTLITFRDLGQAESLPSGAVRKTVVATAEPRQQPAPPSNPPPPPPAEPQPKPAVGQNVDEKLAKDWYQEAISSTEPLMFDTAVANWLDYYPDSGTVASARQRIIGPDWEPEKTKAAADALAKYAKEVTKANGRGNRRQIKLDAIEQARRIYRMF